MPGSEHIIEHLTLKCSLRGKPSVNSVQFRNLKYASIPARYKDSIPNDALRVGQDGVFDATQFGPSCPQKHGAQAFDLTMVGDVALLCLPGQGDTEKIDEFECLHVNVTVPKSALNNMRGNGGRLPVFAWVHGGGLSNGSNSWPQYDLQKFVDRSIKVGKPVIAIAINYRVGLFGFMANEDLGAPGNMGYKDQVLAFHWIKKHISGFGGDPNNVTAAGESAGGISLSTLLCADIGQEGLFDRAAVMSGEATLRKPRNKWWHQQIYKLQSSFFDLKETSIQALGTILLETEAEQLAQQLPLAAHYCGYVDHKWLKEDITLALLADGGRSQHKPAWCQEYVIGDTAHDGTVLKARILDHPEVFDRLKLACNYYLTATETERLLVAYKLNGNPTPEQERDMLRVLATELRFYYPTRAVYKGWTSAHPSKSVSQYHFHVPNPFEGAHKGLASHELDVAFLLQNFNDQLDERNRKIAKSFADHFINFAHGQGLVDKGKVLVVGKDGLVDIKREEYDRLYRDDRGAVLDSIGADRLWKLAEMWQGVKTEDEEGRILAKV